ncbi:hypothetical protein FYF33_20115 [Salmonella enterica]|nr:hypothetical protein [Salmonella enterica]
MDINQKFYDDVIISLMEMNDRLVALEEMAAEHVAEHEALETKVNRIENEHDQAIDSLAHKIGIVGVTAAAQKAAIHDFSKVPEWDLPENAKAIQEKITNAFEDGFAAGEKRAISDDEYEPKYSEISLEIKLKDKTKGYIFFDSMDEAREILKLISRYHAGEIA